MVSLISANKFNGGPEVWINPAHIVRLEFSNAGNALSVFLLGIDECLSLDNPCTDWSSGRTGYAAKRAFLDMLEAQDITLPNRPTPPVAATDNEGGERSAQSAPNQSGEKT